MADTVAIPYGGYAARIKVAPFECNYFINDVLYFQIRMEQMEENKI